MKYLKGFNEGLENSKNPSEAKISRICRKYEIENWTLNPETGLVDVDGHVSLCNRNLSKLPLKFGKVTDYFDCDNNYLTSLEGSPRIVGGNFYFSNNKLVDFDCAPENIGRHFLGVDNELISFEGCPQYIGGVVNLHGNPVQELWTLFENKDDIELFNDFDPIRIIDGQPTVILDRLNSFLEMIGETKVTTLKNYKVI